MPVSINGSGTITGLVANGIPQTVIAGGPAFSAYCNTAQSIPTGTFTKLLCAVEEFDTANAYDNGAASRFTPLVAGYYQVQGEFKLASGSATIVASIYKNGTEFKRGNQSGSAANVGQGATVTALIFLNGSTDYLEFFVNQSSGGSIAIDNGGTFSTNYFQAYLVRNT